jgi:hypothetical protein
MEQVKRDLSTILFHHEIDERNEKYYLESLQDSVENAKKMVETTKAAHLNAEAMLADAKYALNMWSTCFKSQLSAKRKRDVLDAESKVSKETAKRQRRLSSAAKKELPPISVVGKRKIIHHTNAFVVDVTSTGELPWCKLSPFYPWGGLAVPGHPDKVSESLEGWWQGLKVIDGKMDWKKLNITNMKKIKRKGAVLGHNFGSLFGGKLATYLEARHIYVEEYRALVTEKCPELIAQLAEKMNTQPVVLRDYGLNADINNLTKPLSHASIVAALVTEHANKE